jgi:hypothetical protein
VSARAPVKGDTCKVVVCSHCETEFAGGAQRITEHYAKCKSVPVGLKEWEVEKLGRSAAKRQGKEAVKKMEGMFDDIARDSDQALITAALNMNSRATELCNEAICNLVYKQHHAVGPSTIDTADKPLLFNSDRGGGGGEGEKEKRLSCSILQGVEGGKNVKNSGGNCEYRPDHMGSSVIGTS